MTIIRNAEIYKPEYLGIKDVLLIGKKIAAINDNISFDISSVEITEIDARGKKLVPGFIDSHVHITGGGGEGGFSSRTPEINLTDLTTAGVTTVVGCLGTDGVSRDVASLLSKARGLDEEGITAYIYTGSYRLPLKTITGEIMKDIMIVDKIIGIGEVAISDHRSSQPTFEEFIRAVADARVAGMLSGKAGIINVHLGDGKRKIDMLKRAVNETEIPITQFLPTHINRNPQLFEECVDYARNGGFIDFTGSEDPDFWEETEGEVSFSKGLKRLIEEGVDENNYTLSSDGQGSMPIFNEKKEFIGIGIGKSSCLIKAMKDCVNKENIPLEKALRAITCNPAKILKLKNKGRIEVEMDADLCLLDKELNIDTVIANGRLMVQDKKPLVHGMFEKI
ncbi:beta-aspartyl-peptidase [Sedimentibacter sp.]|uniref:beta-aspartyl-peptidase n=1 Tax=Sedimentibacter sp. TaxID=1960295 RepID=UPI00289E2ABD|nr:beta-aspartyl-peptidase [Sedimentibacter sp.]